MLTNEQILDRALEFEHPDPLVEMAGRTGFRHGATWANEQNAAEIAELLDLLGEVDACSPAGSGNIPAWLETRSKVRRLLEKHGK